MMRSNASGISNSVRCDGALEDRALEKAIDWIGRNFSATRNPGRQQGAGRKLPPTERRALDILDAKDNWTKAEIRSAYKALIKVLHPDMNGGDRGHEEQLQEVVWAWDQIKQSRNFK